MNSTSWNSNISLQPTESQLVTIYIIAIYAVSILVLWNLPYIHYILWPFKIFTVALHEFGHAFMGICTGAKIQSITLDPNEGGAVNHLKLILDLDERRKSL